MAYALKASDTFDSTTRSEAILLPRSHNALRHFVIHDNGGAAITLDGAIDFLKNNLTSSGATPFPTHPDNSDLPLIDIRLASWPRMDYVVKLAAVYRRIPGVTVPTNTAYENIIKLGGEMGLRYYSYPYTRDSDGRPNGNLVGMDIPYFEQTVRRPSPYSFTIATKLYIIPTILDTDPTESMRQYENTTNSGTQTIVGMLSSGSGSGLSYPAHCLWYRKTVVRPIELIGDTKYYVEYHVLATEATGFVAEVLLPFPYATTGFPLVGSKKTVQVGQDLSTGTSHFIQVSPYVMPAKQQSFSGICSVHA